MIPAMPGIEEICYVIVNSFVTWRLRFRLLETPLTPASQIALSTGATSALSDTTECITSEKPLSDCYSALVLDSCNRSNVQKQVRKWTIHTNETVSNCRNTTT